MRGSNVSAIIYHLLVCISRKLKSGMKLGLELRYSVVGHGILLFVVTLG